MVDDNLKLLFGSLGNHVMRDQPDSNSVLSLLIKETVKFRDHLKEKTGQTLTVGDTRTALEALETHLNGEQFPKNLTPEQKALAQILIDTVVLFKLR